MPIIEIEIVSRPHETLAEDLAGQIADRAGVIFDTLPGRTWVRLRTLPYDNYAENDIESAVHPSPVFASVLKSRLPEPLDMAREVQALTVAIADLCNRPVDNVHIIYLQPASGRIAFGGVIIPEDK